MLDVEVDLAAQIASLEQVLRSIDPDGELVVAGHDVSQLLPPGLDPARAGEGGREMVRAIDVPASGFGPAMRAGMEAARGDYVLTLDADAPQAPIVARDL